jgi:uncharacterized protein (DUF488 family)
LRFRQASPSRDSRGAVPSRFYRVQALAVLYTIGHSTRSIEELIAALQAHQIRTLVDIRAFPMSRRLPQFHREALDASLRDAGIRYVWMQALGGYRKKARDESPNIALRNKSFRNYADYMLTPEFENGMAELIALAEEGPTAYMCAERVYFRCHRMLVSDWLVAHGHEVLHIDAEGPEKPHRMTAEGRMIDGRLLYRGDRLL